MANNELHDVFLSYRRYEDNEKTNPKGLLLAERIYNYLTEKGLKVFWDKPEMQPGDFAAQIDWQLEHCPSYIFIATENAMRFRDWQEDFVEHELKTALDLYDKAPGDRIILPIFPYRTIEEKQAAAAQGPYDPAVQRIQTLHGVELGSVKPSNDELREILRHVTRITRSNMWNAGYRWLKQAKKERFAGVTINDSLFSLAGKHEEVRFPIIVRKEGEEERPLMDAIRDAKKHLYLIGAGGIGKTTALLRIMEEAYDSDNVECNRTGGQVSLFIELSRAPDVIPDDRGKEWQVYSSGKSTFIHREIYRQIRRDLRLRQIHEGVLEQIDDIYKTDYEVAVKPITNLLGSEKPAPEYLLLLDGLNEISRREIKKYNARGELEFSRSVVSMVLDEIREIMKYKNVRVILTSRSKEAVSFSEDVELLDLSGVKPETIERYLKDMNVPQARIEATLQTERLQEVLRTPLFLILYAKLDGSEKLLTAGEILRMFYHSKKRDHYTQTARTEEVHTDIKDSSENAEPASRLTPEMLCFILDFIFPEIAWRMVKAQEFKIRRDALGKEDEGLDEIIEGVLTDKSETGICGRYASYVFTEYVSESCNDIAEFANAMTERLGGMKRAINAILHCAVYTLGVLYQTDTDYGFTHHHLRDYFSAVYQINRLKLAVYLQGRKKGDLARACLEEWKEHPLPAMTRRFLGEALGEAHNAPWCDEKGCWQYNVPKEPCERNLIKWAFDLFRGRFDGQNGYSVWNLLQVLRDVRGDLSGEDFNALDLSSCEANGCALGKRGLAASLRDARLSERFFLPGWHTGAVHSAAYSLDGRRIVTASNDGTAKIWDAETLQLIGALEGHIGPVYCAAYSPDGRRIVTASYDGTAKIWDAETLQLIGTLEGHTRYVNSAKYNPDGCRIVTASDDGTAKIWDAETLQLIGTLEGHRGPVYCATYSPDDHRIVTASHDGTAKIWDAETLQLIGTLEEHRGPVYCAAYSRDGRRIVTASDVGAVKLWDAETLQLISTLEREHTCFAHSTAAYSPDGRRIVTASGEGDPVKLWDAETLQLIGNLEGHTGSVNCAAFSPDGRRIVTASLDATTKIWDEETLQLIGTMKGHTGSVNCVAYSRCIVMNSWDDTAKLWDAETLRLVGLLEGHTGPVTYTAYSPDGNRIVTASWDNTAKIWDAEMLCLIGTLEGHTDSVHSAVYSPDDRRIVTASWDKTAKLWDAETLQLIGTLEGHTDSVNFAAYNPDGRRVVTASWDKTAKIWDAKMLQVIGTLEGHTDRVTCTGYSPDGRRIVTASEDKTVKIWDAETLQLIETLKGFRWTVFCATYSPDSHYILTASWDAVQVWDAETLRPIGVMEGHTKWVYCAAYSPDGQCIVTASFDGTAKIWDAETFECLHTIYNIPGLEVIGVDLRHLHPDSQLSDEVKERLYEYGAIVDERG